MADDVLVEVLKFDPDYSAVDKALEALHGKVSEFGDWIEDKVSSAWKAVGSAAGTTAGDVLKAFKGSWQDIKKVIDPVGVFGGPAWDAAGRALRNFWKAAGLEGAMKGFGTELAGVLGGAGSAPFKQAGHFAAGFGAGSGLTQLGKDTAGFVLAIARGVKEGFTQFASNPARTLGFLAGAGLTGAIGMAGRGVGRIGGMLRYAGANAGGVTGHVVGAAGSLLSGDLGGTAVHLFGAVSEGLKAVGTAAGAVVTGPFQALSSGLAELGGQLGPIGVGFDVLSGTLQTVSGVVKSIPILGSLLGPFTDAVAALPGIFKDITTTLVSFAAKASPGLFQTWTMALEDVQGVIGQTFLPVLEMMREGVRLFGDVLANILPSSGEARDALAEFRGAFAEMAATIRDTIRQAGPAIRQWFVAGLRELSHWLAVAARAVGMLAEKLRAYFGTAGMLQGGAQFRSSVGAAAREAHFSGFGEYEKALQLAAYKQPGGTVEEQVLAQMTDMVRLENDAKALIEGLDDTWKWLRGAWETFSNWMQKAWADVVAISKQLHDIAILLGARSGHDWLEEANAGILAGVGGRVFRAGQKKE